MCFLGPYEDAGTYVLYFNTLVAAASESERKRVHRNTPTFILRPPPKPYVLLQNLTSSSKTLRPPSKPYVLLQNLMSSSKTLRPLPKLYVLLQNLTSSSKTLRPPLKPLFHLLFKKK